jgi:hypothetical protein
MTNRMLTRSEFLGRVYAETKRIAERDGVPFHELLPVVLAGLRITAPHPDTAQTSPPEPQTHPQPDPPEPQP